jgi:hypothetical protein
MRNRVRGVDTRSRPYPSGRIRFVARLLSISGGIITSPTTSFEMRCRAATGVAGVELLADSTRARAARRRGRV